MLTSGLPLGSIPKVAGMEVERSHVYCCGGLPSWLSLLVRAAHLHQEPIAVNTDTDCLVSRVEVGADPSVWNCVTSTHVAEISMNPSDVFSHSVVVWDNQQEGLLKHNTKFNQINYLRAFLSYKIPQNPRILSNLLVAHSLFVVKLTIDVW